MSGWARRTRRRVERGAVAVEGALITAFILFPLLLGVLYYGNYFWKAQKVQTLSVTGVPPASIAGTYTCAELVERVKQLLAGNVTTLADQLGLDPSLITTTVHAVPTASIGVTLSISYTIPLVNEVTSLLPLPNNGAVVQDLNQQLENVKVTTTSC